MIRLCPGMAAIVAVAVFAGCSGGPKMPARAPVSGVVKVNGQPAANVSVQFIPADEAKGRSATGKADGSGKYVLFTFEPNDGAIPGEYKVVVSSPPAEEKAFKDKKVEFSGAKDSGGTKIPEKYSDPKKTDLKVTVKSGTNDIPLDLK